MTRRRMARLIGVLGAMMILTAQAGADDLVAGEFSIPSIQPLGADTLDRLRNLARSNDEAKAAVERVAADARTLLDAKPHPLEVIHYEGLVNTDPRRIATVDKLREMGDVATLMRHWQATDDPQAAETLRRFIIAWTNTYRPTGNDVNENKLYPLLVAYHGLRSTMPAEESARMDAWVSRFAQRHAKEVEDSTHFTNRYSKHVRLLAICGMILERQEWVDAAREGVKRFVTQSLYANGSSEDLNRRDTLTYHCSSLTPIIELAMLSGDDGPGLYDWTASGGGSIRKSVDYVVPYAMGVKTREEWRHSKVDLDRRRAEAGLEKYRPGRLYDPRDALELMDLASYFDPNLLRVVRHLTSNETEQFPTWQSLVNHALRRNDGIRLDSGNRSNKGR